MSMRDYAVDDYGLVLDDETVHLIASKVFDNYTEDDGEHGNWKYDLYEEGICEYISDFTGETQQVDENGGYWWGNSESYSYDVIVYVQASCYPTLFKKAYNNMDELIDEFKGKLGQYLPEDFDYKSRICHISGTYYG